MVWGLSAKIFLEIFRPPYSLIHFGSVCNPRNKLTTLLNLEILGYTVKFKLCAL